MELENGGKEMLNHCGASLSERDTANFNELSLDKGHACSITIEICQPGQLNKRSHSNQELNVSIVHL